MNAAATDIHDSTPAETQAHLRCWKRVAEASFVARLRAGDAAAFNELVDRHRARMMVTATRIRAVTHLDVNRKDIDTALKVISDALAA